MLDKILVLDMDTYGSIAIARKLRSQRIYCKILPGDATLADVADQEASGIVWVGGVDGSAAALSDGILSIGVPLLAVGSAASTLARMLGGTSQGAVLSNTTATVKYTPQVLFESITPGDRWFTCAEQLTMSERMMPIATAGNCVVAFCDKELPLYGLQFQIEKHDPDGVELLKNFCTRICGCTPWWSTDAFIERAVGELSRLAGDGPLAVALSGGVDSTVCAALAQRAVGSRLKPIMVRTGLHRGNIEKQIGAFCWQHLGIEMIVVDAQERIYDALRGKADQAGKSDAVREVFRTAVSDAAGDAAREMTLVLGTNYSEILDTERRHRDGNAHDGFKGIVEPLKELFKDEVRAVGDALGLPATFVNMQPMPIEGLASRIDGVVSEELVETLRAADSIYREEIETGGQDKRLQQYFATLESTIDPGHKMTLVLKAMATGDKAGAARLPFDLMERTVERVRHNLPCIGRVLYDLTPTLST